MLTIINPGGDEVAQDYQKTSEEPSGDQGASSENARPAATPAPAWEIKSFPRSPYFARSPLEELQAAQGDLAHQETAPLDQASDDSSAAKQPGSKSEPLYQQIRPEQQKVFIVPAGSSNTDELQAKPENSNSEQANKVRTGLSIIILAVKNYALYPEANSVRRQSLLKAQRWLKNYFEEEQETSLRLVVEADHLLFNGEVVYKDKPEEHGIFFPLFRDGIQWFEFIPGITAEELRSVIDILNRFRTLRDEPEDDLVTALWEQNLQYIKYKTADGFGETNPIIDIASLKVTGALDREEKQSPDAHRPLGATVTTLQPLTSDADSHKGHNTAPAVKPISELFNYFDGSAFGEGSALEGLVNDLQGESGPNSDGPALPKQAGPIIIYPIGEEKKGSAWFTPQEIEQLKNLIIEDALRDNIQDCLEIMLILLDEAKDCPDSSSVIEFLSEEIKYALSQGGFFYVRALLEKFRDLSCENKPWLPPLINELYKRISTSDVLEALLQAWPSTHLFKEQSFIELRHFLLLLPPQSVYALTPIMAKTGNSRTEKILLEAIAVKACQAVLDDNIEFLLSGIRESLLKELVGLLKSRKEPGATKILSNLTRHVSPHVRETAAQALLENNPENIKKIAHLLDDSYPGLSHLICEHLSRQRGGWAEKVLLNYLSNAYKLEHNHNKNHILNCYRALGHCARPRSIPFLQRVLLKKDWRSLLGVEACCGHRRGAALALLLMPIEWNTGRILKKASSSCFRNVRLAYRQAVKEVEQTRRRQRDD